MTSHSTTTPDIAFVDPTELVKIKLRCLEIALGQSSYIDEALKILPDIFSALGIGSVTCSGNYPRLEVINEEIKVVDHSD